MDDPKLYDLIDSQDPRAVLEEILVILELLDTPQGISSCIEEIYGDIVRLFRGNYPGYRAANTQYHNLEHTTMVALATTRLIHGCAEAGFVFDSGNVLLGELAALFHDSGLIQTEEDRKGTGAKYTIGHEERSIAFMSENLSGKGFSEQQVTDCGNLIQMTELDLDISKIVFRTPQLRTLGKIVGSSDLLAQIADRYYLEKLLLLYREFEEAGVPDIESEEHLLRKTEDFYKYVARKRLNFDFEQIASYMRHHFKVRWGIDRDLYSESIHNNIEYLKAIFSGDRSGRKWLYRHLKRGGIVGRIRGQPGFESGES